MSNKNNLISFLQAFGITLVVLGHSFLGHDNNAGMKFIYAFHMPLFMFVSGFLLPYATHAHGQSLKTIKLTGWNGFIWKKIKRLLIPYVTISSLTFVPKALLSHYAVRPIDISFQAWGHMLLYPWDNVIIFFWFLPTLFLIMCLVMFAIRLAAKLRITVPGYIILALLALLYIFNPAEEITFLNLRGIVNFLFFFVLGMYSCKYLKPLVEKESITPPPDCIQHTDYNSISIIHFNPCISQMDDAGQSRRRYRNEHMPGIY